MSVFIPTALDFLERLPGMVHKRLYQQPSTALAVFRRMLPHLAKTIVMGMLYMADPLPETDLDAWIRPDARAEREQAMSVLEQLHIVSKAQEIQGPKAFSLAPGFARSLRQALTGGGNHKSFGLPCSTPDDHKVDVKLLNAFATRQWEAILYYMVGSTGAGLTGEQTISHGTKQLLTWGDFVAMKGSRAVITQSGFTFLLQEVNAQVWSLLIVYLENADRVRKELWRDRSDRKETIAKSSGKWAAELPRQAGIKQDENLADLSMDQVEVLSFLFTLGSLEVGQDYSTENLTATQLHMLDDLTDFGIVYRSSPTSTRFYPTRLATTLTSDTTALANTASPISNSLHGSSGANKGYIIIETNYRLYAYTSSLLQIAVLSLFARLTTRFPNLVSGKLTKESVQRAISYGITSDQIISYLTTHAHPQMAKRLPILPPTVVDQIRLWQIEGDRMKATAGFLMKEFPTQADFDDVVRYAENLGVMVWKNEAKRYFFASRIEQISSYMKGRANAKKAEKGV